MQRVLGVMQREGHALLTGRIAESASDIDVVMLMGYLPPDLAAAPCTWPRTRTSKLLLIEPNNP
jgi:hypothetical protein